MTDITFTADEAVDIINEDHDLWKLIEDKRVSSSRWYDNHEAVITTNNQTFYMLRYQTGSTELQECYPFDDGLDTIAVQVYPQQVIKTVFKPIPATIEGQTWQTPPQATQSPLQKVSSPPMIPARRS